MNFILAVISLLLFPPTEGATAFYIRPESKVEVHGKSNVTPFVCQVEGSHFSDTISIRFREIDASVRFSQFLLSIPVDKIGCGNRIMTNDMKKTLEEKEHPTLNIQFLDYTPNGEWKDGYWLGHLHSRFVIAGVQKEYWHPVSIRYKGDLTYIEGDLPIRMNEFNLSPKASVPLVKVAEEISVHYAFVFERLGD